MVDTGRLSSGTEDTERQRRLRLLTIMVDKKDDTIRLAAAMRIVSVLAHIDTDKSRKLLSEIGKRSGELGRLASLAIQRDNLMTTTLD